MLLQVLHSKQQVIHRCSSKVPCFLSDFNRSPNVDVFNWNSTKIRLAGEPLLHTDGHDQANSLNGKRPVRTLNCWGRKINFSLTIENKVWESGRRKQETPNESCYTCGCSCKAFRTARARQLRLTPMSEIRLALVGWCSVYCLPAALDSLFALLQYPQHNFGLVHILRFNVACVL